MNLWLIFILIGIAAFLIRISFIALIGRRQFLQWLRRALRFVPAAVFAALVVPELFYRSGVFTPASPQLIAGLVAIAIAWRTRSVLLTIISGVGVLWALNTVLAA